MTFKENIARIQKLIGESQTSKINGVLNAFGIESVDQLPSVLVTETIIDFDPGVEERKIIYDKVNDNEDLKVGTCYVLTTSLLNGGTLIIDFNSDLYDNALTSHIEMLITYDDKKYRWWKSDDFVKGECAGVQTDNESMYVIFQQAATDYYPEIVLSVERAFKPSNEPYEEEEGLLNHKYSTFYYPDNTWGYGHSMPIECNGGYIRYRFSNEHPEIVKAADEIDEVVDGFISAEEPNFSTITRKDMEKVYEVMEKPIYNFIHSGQLLSKLYENAGKRVNDAYYPGMLCEPDENDNKIRERKKD